MGQAMIRESTQLTNICLVKIDHFRKMACRSAGSKSTTRWRCCKRANLPALEQFQCLQTNLALGRVFYRAQIGFGPFVATRTSRRVAVLRTVPAIVMSGSDNGVCFSANASRRVLTLFR